MAAADILIFVGGTMVGGPVGYALAVLMIAASANERSRSQAPRRPGD